MKALVIHGPNLNLLGTREPDVYGSLTLADLDDLLRTGAGDLGIEIEIHQTAREGEFIELLHAGIGEVDGAVVNPGAYSHTSRAIADAIRAVPYPVVEVHLSNIHAREPWRRHSVTAEAAAGVIAGLGPGSYLAGLAALKALTEGKGES
ncbi:MAG: 3-dehydroquinate dehydratase [Actinomycetota bacterium]|nr:3-dehydroquinate dehydratase [Actinomycetota bacterium]